MQTFFQKDAGGQIKEKKSPLSFSLSLAWTNFTLTETNKRVFTARIGRQLTTTTHLLLNKSDLWVKESAMVFRYWPPLHLTVHFRLFCVISQIIEDKERQSRCKMWWRSPSDDFVKCCTKSWFLMHWTNWPMTTGLERRESTAICVSLPGQRESRVWETIDLLKDSTYMFDSVLRQLYSAPSGV